MDSLSCQKKLRYNIKKIMDDFAVFILTHGRPDSIKTIPTLKKHGYTGKIVIVIDDEDKSVDQYIKKYGDQVQVFDKEKVSKSFDEADNFKDRRAIVYARNACFQIAQKLEIQYFVQLDDDYQFFEYRFCDKLKYSGKKILNLNSIFTSILKFFKNTKIKTIALSQNGDFMGGKNSAIASKIQLKRKAMNSFFCKADEPIHFVGRINEDVNTYTSNGSLGDVFFTMSQVSLQQTQTQKSQGGMTELYLTRGTYIKSFYTVMFSPSSVTISEMGYNNRRLHHQINWNKTVPKIISQTHKKK